MSEHTIAHAELVPADESATSLVRMAIERGVDVEVIERLVALQERHEDRTARAAFFAALATFQEVCPPVKKNKKASVTSKREGAKGYSYTYATLDELQRHIRPYLQQTGFSYFFDVEAEGKGMLVVNAVLRHLDGHSERSRFPVPVDSSDRMSSAQSNGAALTYGKRQSLTAVLGLSIEEDTDGKRVDTIQYITDEQSANIGDLIDAAGVRKYKFLEWLGAESVSQILAADFQKAVDELDARIRKNRDGDA